MNSQKPQAVSKTFIIGILRSEMMREISVSPPCRSLMIDGLANKGVRIGLIDSLKM